MNEAQKKLFTVEEWLAATYGSNPPSIFTVRRWIREGHIWPKPEKHGRAYYLRADARYIDPKNPPSDLKPSGRKTALLQKASLA